MAEDDEEEGLASELVQAFLRLSQGDFSVRLPRNFQRDNADALAFFVNLIAEQLDRLLTERDRGRRRLETDIQGLIEKFLALAAGDFSVRATRTFRGDAIDVLTFVFNNMAAEIGDAVSERDRQRAMLETILESMIDGVLLLDANGVVVRSNGAMARLLGRTPAELVAEPIAALLAPGESDLASHLGRSVDSAPFRSRPTLFRTWQGETLSMAVSGSPQRDESGSLMGVVLVARDDRELKQAQMQLQMSDRLATMGMLAAGVAHEVNNPLAFVSANLEFVAEEIAVLEQEGSLSAERIAEVTRALKSSRGGADRVRQIVRDLRTFSRSDPESTGRIELNALLELTIGLIHNEIRHHARLTKKFGTPPDVEANEVRLIQVFLNLLQNAAQAIPIGSAETHEICIVTGTDARGAAVVEVHDTGCGIPEANLPLIFDLFFTSKPVGVGTGLGLSICHRLVEQIGGRIEVESRVGAGTMFRVVLPAAAPDPSERPRATRPSLRAQAVEGLRVLVIDDEVEVGESIRRILGREQHTVEITTSADEAQPLITTRHYDVVFCDLLMPDVTGMDLHERMVAKHPRMAERMVFMTGGAFSAAARDFLARVPNARFEKPFDAALLRSIVERARE